ncbi:unnamed protein product [Striga asiatica]|uniref:Uncharacterized protein n=1 Tax=Striga asiatica TaxID=4170 RepID=A0A5A7QKM8_STRAF|nr:unnamed protein product [Striga asiatica]
MCRYSNSRNNVFETLFNSPNPPRPDSSRRQWRVTPLRDLLPLRLPPPAACTVHCLNHPPPDLPPNLQSEMNLNYSGEKFQRDLRSPPATAPLHLTADECACDERGAWKTNRRIVRNWIRRHG